MHILRIFLLLFLLPGVLSGQQHTPADTVVTLQEVKIQASRRENLTPGHPYYMVDSMAVQLPGQNLALLLSRHSGMFIKSYGPAGLATTSLRGGSAAHTAILWNGFSLQSPMHQQSDLSLLPVFFMDEVGVQHGGGSALWGSGAMGGAIFLNNKAFNGEGLNVRAGLIASSLEDFGQHLWVQYGGKTLSTRLRVFNLNSGNRYHYYNTSQANAPLELQKNAAMNQWGILQENYLQLGNNHTLKLRWWLQDNARNLPPALQQNHNGAFQKDDALRLTGEWQSNFGRVIAIWRGAYFKETLLYRDSINLESLSSSNTLVQEGEIRWQAGSNLVVYSGGNLQFVQASAREYSQSHSQNGFSLYSSVAWEPLPKRLKAVGSLRQEFIAGMNIPLAPSMGVSWKAFESLILAANAGKNYRVPSLNDRYWIPGGNPQLLPESGWSQDITATWQAPYPWGGQGNKPSIPFIEQASATFFHRNISNWIIWLPQDGGMLWSPENVMEVRGYGLELRTSGAYRLPNLEANWNLNWDHVVSRNTKARSLNDASVGKQLIYVPFNRAGAFLSLRVKTMMLTYSHHYTGKKYITSDNTQSLKAYNTADMGLSWSGSVSDYTMELFVNAVNIWNQSYQVMAARPMPLRYFQAGITIHFLKNQ